MEVRSKGRRGFCNERYQESVARHRQAISLLRRLSISPLPVPAGWYAVPLGLFVGLGFFEHGYAKLARGADGFIAILHAVGMPFVDLVGWATIAVKIVGGLFENAKFKSQLRKAAARTIETLELSRRPSTLSHRKNAPSPQNMVQRDRNLLELRSACASHWKSIIPCQWEVEQPAKRPASNADCRFVEHA
jgi:hypothetical protein